MSVIDMIIIGIMVLSALISLVRGFVKEAISLSSWAIAFWVSFTFNVQMSEILNSFITIPESVLEAAPNAIEGLGFLSIFILVLIAGGIISHVIGLVLLTTGLTIGDKLIGVIFGAARGFLIVTTLIMLSWALQISKEDWYQESTLVPYFEASFKIVKEYLPPNISEYYDSNEKLIKSLTK